MYKELANDPKVDFPRNEGPIPTHGFLQKWAEQGVLLLNNVLTVRRADANSHKKLGWHDFTDEVIRVLLKHRQSSDKKQDKLVFLLWGKPANTKAQKVIARLPTVKSIVISTSHPSPLGAHSGPSPFMGSKCFSRANAALEKMGLEPIDWNVDDLDDSDGHDNKQKD